MNEADTCRRLVVPRLQAAGWDTEPCSIAEQRSITDGRRLQADTAAELDALLPAVLDRAFKDEL